MADKNVLPRVALLTESLAKSLISSAVANLQHRHGLTDIELAERLFCDAGTVSNARNKHNKLSVQTTFNLLAVDPLALEGLLNFYGRRSVPIEAKCDTDALVSTAGAVHKLAAVQCATSPGGKTITDGECVELEPFLDAALESLGALKQRAEAIRLARAA